MKEILDSLKTSIDGIIEIFLMDTKGNIFASNISELLEKEIKKVASSISLFITLISDKLDVDRLDFLSSEGAILVVIRNNFALVCITSRKANLDFLYLLGRQCLRLIEGNKS